MRRLRRLTGLGRWLAALVVALAPVAAAADPGQVYLVQASGWMDGYLNNTGGAFQGMVARFVELTRADGWPIAVASFNRQEEARARAGDCSPRTLYPVDACDEAPHLAAWSADGVARALAAVQIPRNPNGSLANSFLDEALARARDIHLGAAPQGIVWIVTNNKNAPVGEMSERAVIDSSRAFLRILGEDPQISGVSAIPCEMRASSAAYPRFGVHHGFMIYGVAYGDSGRRLLRFVTARPEFQAEFGRPFRLRPLDDEPLRLSIAAQKADEAVDAVPDEGDGLRVTGVEVGRPAPLVLRAALENTIYPFVIARASLKLAWEQGTPGAGGGTLSASIDPTTVTDVAPGTSREITVSLDFSAIKPPEISRLKSQVFEESGRLHLEMTDIVLASDPAAVERLRKVYLGDAVGTGSPSADSLAIPEIFVAGRRLAKSDGAMPIRFVAAASPIDMFYWILLAIAVGFSVLFFIALLLKPRKRSVMIEGQRKYFYLRPMATETFVSPSGRKYTIRGGLLGERSARVVLRG
jgi:hypothetical protein